MDERLLWQVAALRHGLFTRADALQAGLTPEIVDYRLAVDRWESVFPEVYRISGVPTSWQQTLHAACLAQRGKGVASHRAAAALWQFPGFKPDMIEVVVSHRDWFRHPGVNTRYSTKLPACDITDIGGIPTTTAARTLLDLCSLAPKARVEEALDDAERRGLITMALMQSRLDDLACRGRRGVRIMRELLARRDPAGRPPESVQERRLLRALERAGLPLPALQFEVYERKQVVARVDAAYPDSQLAIEYDSYIHHGNRAKFERDLARRNTLTRLGWRVIHVTADDLRHGAALAVAAIRAALRAA